MDHNVLAIAVLNGSEVIVKLLLDKAASVETCSGKMRSTILHTVGESPYNPKTPSQIVLLA